MSYLRRAAFGVGTLLAAFVLFIPSASAEPSEQDLAWMEAAHQSNLAEIAAGEAAQEHGHSDHVREAGATLVADHEALDADLMAAADEHGVELPTEPTAEQQAALEDVMAHDGEAFDTAWIASQIEAHQMSVAAAEEQIASGSDEAVIALAEAAHPVIQGHLDHLMEMHEGAPHTVPTGLGDDGSPALLGASLSGLGLLAMATSLVLFRRREQIRN